MEQLPQIGQVELGRYLSQLRERAGVRQAELARKITWSPAVLSRVESGDRQVAADELNTILRAIGTEEASRLGDALQRDWSVLPRPSLDHPDQDLLWSAEQVAKELVELRDRPEVRSAFERRLTEYISEIQKTAGLLIKRDHQIAFIGSIGIGKSTAICRMTGLEVSGQESSQLSPVLEAGAGGITICEVHLRTGPSYGLIIEPRSDEEVRADVTDFAEHILKGNESDAAERVPAGGEPDSQGISKEIERAVRNLAGLKVRREKDTNGKTTRNDEAKELAQRFPSVREFVVETLARMELHRRDRRDIWYDSGSGKSPLIWLKETFEHINNGRHPEFTLPKRIEVVVPEPLLKGSDLSIRIIDTKGIDRTAARADLECHLDDPHTVAILCSGFNNAPAAETRLLLERANEIGVRSLGTRAALLVLPRTNEALAVKDESGNRVDSIEEGYELKGEQVTMAVEPIGLQGLAVGFFNAYQDDPERLRVFLAERLTKVREQFCAKMLEIITNARALLSNHAEEQVQEVIRAAAKLLGTWATQNSRVKPLKTHIQDSLLSQMETAYASTIRATVRREGEWPNFSYSHHLGYGARRMAALSLGSVVEGFTELCKTLANNPDHLEAKDLVNQADRVLQNAYEELLRKVQLMGQTIFVEALKVDGTFWVDCMNEWGQGPGYRNRVMSHNEKWFTDDSKDALESELRALIEREWKDALTRMTALLETEK
jgi:transcriptional regulator with XRE-family HTH domain